MLTESGFFKEERTSAAGARSSVPPNLAPGKLIADKYELLRKLGTGAMGEVWAAKHLSLDEEVAIKLVLRDVQHEDGSTADSRFLLEARVARMLSRKTRHIVSVTDHGDDGPVAYLVMELLNGEPLDIRLGRSGALPVEKVVPIVQQVARALSVAHEAGIVHRDLKPGNVFLTLDEEGKVLIKILDFGIAKLSSMPEENRPSFDRDLSTISNRDPKHATLRGFLLGTPAYMSPEQARGKSLDHRADVWALAVIAYQLLTTQFPFDGATPDELFKRIVRVQPFPITDHRTDLPPAIGALFARAFAKRIDDRFQNAESFVDALAIAAGMKADKAKSIITPMPMKAVVTPRAAKTTVDSEITPAGLPQNNRLVNRVLAIAAIGLLALGGGFAYSFANADTKPARGLAAGASTEATGMTTLTQNDDLIPPPPPVEKGAPVDVAPPPPPAPEPEVAPTPPPTGVAEEAVPAPVTFPEPQPQAPAPAKKPADKSEVF